MPVNVEIKTRRGTAAEWASANPVLSDGEPGLETDTGVIKYGDDVSHWDELPEAHKQFRNIVTVSSTGKAGTANFICSKYASDAACIQDVMNSVPSNSIIHFMEGTYNINTAITSLGKNFSWTGDGKVTWNVGTAGSSDIATIRLSGSSVLDTTISTDAAMHSLTVTLSDVTDIAKGDLISIFNTDLWSPVEAPGQKTGEMYEIISVDVGTKVVTLSQSLYRNYLASNTTVRVYRPAKINIENIDFVGTGRTEQSNALHILYGSHCRIENCSFSNFGKRAINLASCYDALVSNNYIQGCTYAGFGYGIMIVNGCAYIKIDKNCIVDCRHTVAAGSGAISYDGSFVGGDEVLNRGVIITNNLLVGAIMATSYGNTIDSHPATLDYTIIGNKIYPSFHIDATYYSTYAFGDATQSSIFSNNTIYGGGGVMRRPGAPSSNCIIENNILENTRGAGLYSGYYYDNHSGCLVNLKIHGNIVKNASKTSQMTTDGDPVIYLGREDYRSVSILGNTVDGCTLDALRVYESTSVSTGPIKLTVGNNNFNNVGGYGVYIRRSEISTLIDFLIQNNIITEVNQAGSIYGGIALVDVENGRVEGNYIINRTLSANPSIKEVSALGSAVNNNRITNNTVSGFSGGIVKVGANSKISNNPGYQTENTGTATIPASGVSIIVPHGLATTPTNVIVTPRGNIGYCWADTFTATQFTIHCSAAPVSDTIVGWSGGT